MSRSRLDTVVRIRALQERVARGEVERERHIATRAAGAVDDAVDAVASRSARPTPSVQSFVAHRSMLEVGLDRIAGAQDSADAARAEVDLRLDEWTAATRRLDGVERLDERLRRERRHADDVRAQTELDDLVVTRWKRAAS